MITKLH